MAPRSCRTAGAISILVLTLAASGPAVARELAGFPVALTEGSTKSSPAVGDVNGDGNLDVVVGFGEWLHVVGVNGAPVEGFPKKIGELDPDAKKHFAASPSLCDLDGSGKLSIVTGGPDNRLYVVSPEGMYRQGWPIDVGAQIESAPLCADVDGDGGMEIVVAVPAQHVAGFEANGRAMKGFPITSVRPAESAIAAGDLDPGGPLELMVGGDDGRLHFFDGAGKVDQRRTAKTSYKITGGPSLGDIDGDGQFDVVFGSQDFNIYAVDGKTFDLKPGFPVATGYRIYGSPALGDLTGDGVVDIVVGSADGLVYAVDGKGKQVPGWPVKVDGKVIGSVGIGDVDLDNELEVVAVGSTGQTYVFKQNGRPMRGTPFKTPGKNDTSPFIAELDGKRGLEIAVVTSRSQLYLFSVRAAGKLAAGRIPWPGYAHDAQRVSRTYPNPAVFIDLRIEPPRPRTTDTLEVKYTYQDLDGGAEGKTRVAWYRDGKRVSELDNARTVPPSFTKKGERWNVQVQEADDYAIFAEGLGAKIWNSTQTQVLNTPAEAPKLAATGAAAGEVRFGDEITVQVAADSKDVDGDKVRYRTVWTVDEAPVKTKPRSLAFPSRVATFGQRVAVTVIPEDGASDGEPASLEWLVKNTPPTPPQVAIEPATPTRASGARLVVKKAGTDPDKKSVHHEIVWKLDGQLVPLLAVADEVPGMLLRRGAKLTAEVVTHDGADPSSVVVTEAVVGNNAPGTPAISILPSAPTADTAIGVTVTTRAADVDGDVPGYHIEWLENGKPIPELNEQWVVPKERLKKGQIWRAVVTADDGAARGKPAVAQTKIENRAPLPPAVAIAPNPPVGADALELKVLREATDPDGDNVRLKVEWLVDGTAQGGAAMQGSNLKAGMIKKGQRVQVRVTPIDGEDAGRPSGDAVFVGDRPPSAPTVTLAPRAPRTRDNVTMTIARAGSDPDGDKVTYRTHWFVNGARVDLPDTTPTLDAQYFREGDRIAVEVRSVADGMVSDAATADVTAVSTPPPAPGIALEPEAPLPGEPLRVKVVSQEADADGNPVRYEVRWLNGGRAIDGAALDGVKPGVTQKGEVWRVEVVAVDGKDKASAVSQDVTIGNQTPVPPRIRLTKETVTTTEPVTLEIAREATDPDGDRLRLEIRWKKNGAEEPALAQQTTVAADKTKKGDTWEVEVVANDGVAKSDPVRASFAVVDTPPTAPRIAFNPSQPVAGSDVEVTIVAPGTDVDGDAVSHDITWFVDGKPMKSKKKSKSSFRAPGKALQAHKELMAEVVAVGAGARSLVARVSAEVAPTRPPPPQVAILPKEPKPGETLFAKVTPPARRETPARIDVSWLKNGAAVGINAPTVPGELVKRGDKWAAIAVAVIDGKSSKDVRDEVVIGNRAPAAAVIKLSKRQVPTTEAVSLTVVTAPSDPDGDKLTTTVRWSRDGKRESKLDDQRAVPAAMTAKGEVWVASVVASDGQLESPVVTDAFTVVDTSPPAVSVGLSPSSPKAGDAITASINPTAQDVDGDKVSYRVRYLVNGVPATGHDGKSPVLVASAFGRGDRIVVEVVPFDGELEGPMARAEVMAQNSPPALAGVAVTPAKPTPGDALACRPTKDPSDPDGDSVTVHVMWEIDGKPAGSAGAFAELSPGQVRPGQRVACKAFATDGSLVSPQVAAAAVEVSSRAPGGIEVALFPPAPTTGEGVRCGAKGTPTDADGDPIAVEVEARIDGKKQPSTEIAAGKLTAGQTVECRAVPKDGRETGALASVSVKVGNARPVAPVPKLSHHWPRAGVDNLECEVATIAKDPEGDKIRYRIEWFKNGQPAGLPGNVRQIPAGELKVGDLWVCRLSAQDGEGDGELAATSAALVREDPTGGAARNLKEGGPKVRSAGR